MVRGLQTPLVMCIQAGWGWNKWIGTDRLCELKVFRILTWEPGTHQVGEQVRAVGCWILVDLMLSVK